MTSPARRLPRCEIVLEETRPCYHPGDIIKGQITVNTFYDEAITDVSISLLGQEKTKITLANGQSTSTFRGRVELFSSTQTLGGQHYTQKAGIFQWPFLCKMPHSVEKSLSTKTKWKPKRQFLGTGDIVANSAVVNTAAALSPDSERTNGPISNQGLHIPPTSSTYDARAGKQWYSRVSYILEARVTTSQGGSSSNTHRVVRHINAFPVPAQSSAEESALWSKDTTIKTLRLDPEKSDLTWLQKWSSVFSRKQLPRLTFGAQLAYPNVLRPFENDRFPFTITVTPRTSPDLTTIQPTAQSFYRYPSVIVRSVMIGLDIHQSCRCLSLVKEQYAEKETTHTLAQQKLPEDEVKLIVRSMAWNQKNRVDEETPPPTIDLAALCNASLSLAESVSSGKGKGKGKEKAIEETDSSDGLVLAPSYQSFISARQYHFSWVIELECAGQMAVLKGKSAEPVTVLGPDARKARKDQVTKGSAESIFSMAHLDELPPGYESDEEIQIALDLVNKAPPQYEATSGNVKT